MFVRVLDMSHLLHAINRIQLLKMILSRTVLIPSKNITNKNNRYQLGKYTHTHTHIHRERERSKTAKQKNKYIYKMDKKQLLVQAVFLDIRCYIILYYINIYMVEMFFLFILFLLYICSFQIYFNSFLLYSFFLLFIFFNH
jgi:hypothetical protein